MGLGAPPAAASALVEHRHARPQRRSEARAIQLLEILVVAGQRNLVGRYRGRGLLERDGAFADGVAETGLRADRAPGEEVLHKSGEDTLGLSADDHVDPGERTLQGGAHRTLAIRAAEHDPDRGNAGLETLRQLERGDRLVGARRETHDRRRGGGDDIGAAVEE